MTEQQENNTLKEAGLRHSSPDAPGMTRRRCGKGFIYVDDGGKRIEDPRHLNRIRSLVIPPAWKHVWICRDPCGHIQAVGCDDRGRRQYLYHERWQAHQQQTKYEQQLPFAEKLPLIRRRAMDDMKRADLSRECVLGCAIRLLDQTLIRVGSERYRRTNRSYGITTLREKHVSFNGHGELRFRFKGKSGVEHEVDLEDPLVEDVLHDLMDLPGQHLFRYLDSAGEVHSVDSTDVNDYLREISGGASITAKDFRTWGGTSAAVEHLLSETSGGLPDGEKLKKVYDEAVCRAAERLNNTRATCRDYYVNPSVWDALESGRFLALSKQARQSRRLHGLRLAERMTWRVIGGH